MFICFSIMFGECKNIFKIIHDIFTYQICRKKLFKTFKII